MEWLLIPILAWVLLLVALLPDKRFYTSLFDRIMQGTTRDDRNSLQIMYNHLINKPEEWSVSRTAASFPLEGAKQIYLNYDEEKKHWGYTIPSSGERERVLDGHYGALFNTALSRESDKRQSQALLRNLYGLEGPLLLR